jgi:N-acetylmuramoyl-L-alanine amidase
MRLLAVAWFGVAALLGPQAPSVETLYADAVAKETAVRKALTADRPDPTLLKAIRTVVSDFESIVRLYPNSGFADDALWRAGLTALEGFNKFGEASDRDAGLRLLRTLSTQYPASRLAGHVPEVVEALDLPSPPVSVASAPAPAPRAVSVATIRQIKRTVLPDVVRITIELDAEVPFHDERLENPARVFVDLAGTRAAPALLDKTLRFDDAVALGRQVRLGRHPNNTTRIVVDASGMTTYSIYPLYEPYRLVIDCVRATPAKPLLAVLPSKPIKVDWTGTVSSPLPEVTAVPPERNLAGGFSIARQLGLSVSRIVIDPGHGGHDPGATGKGLTEAELVLDLALRVEKLLLKVPGTEVILTRRSDDYVPLEDRTELANREGADLFLSIHANANSNSRVRGVETYFLNFAQNLTAAAVAARENAASGQAMRTLPDLLKTIALNNKIDESRELATMVQRAMIQKLKPADKTVKDLGVKQAPFMVLIGAAMPSVLAEVSFMTNPADVRLLRQPTYRQRIAEALFDAIQKYQTSLKSQTRVAVQ